VSEANVGKVRPGQPTEVQLDALPDVRFRGEVHRLVPTVDRARATVTVKIRLIDKDARLLPEMSAKVAFLSRAVAPEQAAPRTAVPTSAVVERNGRRVVYVVREGRAQEIPAEPGTAIGDMVEVSAARVGERVVLKPGERVRHGAAVSAAAR
jgi:HlyD family secretion protein